jgi:hypothetical protein
MNYKRDKTQSILTQIVAHLDYSAMVKQRSLGPDNMEDGTDPSSAFLDALRTRAMDEMHEAALEYGIVLKDLAVIDRQFKGMHDIVLSSSWLQFRCSQVKSLPLWTSLQPVLCKLKSRLPCVIKNNLYGGFAVY